MKDTLLHFPIYIGDALKKFIEYPTLEERGAWISIVVAMIHNDGELPDENLLMRHALIFDDKDKQSLSKALAKLKQNGMLEEVKSLINKQKSLRKKRQEAGKKGGKISKKNKQSLSNSESESELELETELNRKKNEKKKVVPDVTPPHPEYDYLRKEGKEPFKKSGKGWRLTEDWALCEEWGVWAQEKTEHTVEHILKEAEKFKIYFLSENAKAPIKKNWFQAWQNWIMR